jgi:branched-chain amino acid transport system ATP-binding protein
MLKVTDLHVHYGTLHAVQGISLEIPAGAIVALLGINGAGKSSLLGAIAGIVRASAGKVEFDGANLTGLSADRVVRHGISLVPERRDLFPEMSVAENLAMGAYSRSDAGAVASDLERILGYFPILEQRSRQRAALLSGGEQQMLAIGRALMARPRALLLDEPSLGLAPRMLDAIFGIIERINKQDGTTVFLVEQNTHLALAVASFAHVIETGRLVAAGTSQELLGSDLVKQSFLGTAAAQQG